MASNTSTWARQTLQTAFEAGRVGFKKNMVNPFNTCSDLYKEWERGYNKEYFENLNRLKESGSSV